jgi:hypothetical protein
MLDDIDLLTSTRGIAAQARLNGHDLAHSPAI